jgi:glutamate-1-semialdehyde 2,1-aminomutase
MSTVTPASALSAFSQRFSTSARMSAAGRDVIPGGYSRSSFNFGPHAVYVESGDGAHLTTVEGHRLLDLNNNFTVNILGHRHQDVEKAVMSAIEDGFSFGNPVALETQLAALLTERIPSIDKVQFSCSASESCLTAVRVARAFTGRTKFAKFEGGYHGFTDPLQISVHPEPDGDCGPDDAPHSTPDSAGIPPEEAGNVVVLTQNDLAGTERILRARGHEIACVVVELETAAGGLVTLTQAFVDGLRAVTEELGILLVIDETVTLRAGLQGMQGMYGVVPDLTVMGKIIGGGFPLGAVGGSAAVMEALVSGGVHISGTHHGHKVALAAGIATMSTLTESAFARLNGMAARVLTELDEWCATRGSSFRVFGRGTSHLGYAFLNETDARIATHRDYWRLVDGERTQTYSLELANRGFFPVARGNISLSLPMTDDDIAAFIETSKEIVTAIEQM